MKIISKSLKAITLVGALTIGAVAAVAGMSSVNVGGSAMLPSKNIVENAVNSKDHTTLVAAVKAAGLVPTLQSKGPFTVFAPTNEAFGKLPDGTVETLLKPENLETLKGILTYHVVSGKMDRGSLWSAVKKGKGTAELKTVAGGKLWVMANGDANLMLKDEKGNVANIPTYDVFQSNGVIHVIDSVMMPK